MSSPATAPLTRRGLGGRRCTPREAPAQTGIVHLGLGAFHRAHQAMYTALALEHEPAPWGIAGVAGRSHHVADALRAQDGLYAILELGSGGARDPLVVGVRWEAAGAIFSDDVRRYEQLKLRLLNATHSLIAYLGLLAGARTIAEAVGRPAIRAAAEHALHAELLPTLAAPPDLDVAAYVEQLFGRFANAALEHRACQVASDGSLKLPVRHGPKSVVRRVACASPSTAPSPPTTACSACRPSAWRTAPRGGSSRPRCAASTLATRPPRSARTCSTRWRACPARTAWSCNCTPASCATIIAPRSRRTAPTRAPTSPCGPSSRARCGRCSGATGRTRACASCCSPSTRRRSRASSRRSRASIPRSTWARRGGFWTPRPGCCAFARRSPTVPAFAAPPGSSTTPARSARSRRATTSRARGLLVSGRAGLRAPAHAGRRGGRRPRSRARPGLPGVRAIAALNAGGGAGVQCTKRIVSG